MRSNVSGKMSSSIREPTSELELSQLLFISIRQRELIRVLTVLSLSVYTYSGWFVHCYAGQPFRQ